MTLSVDDSRITDLNDAPYDNEGSCVIYWMQKDQRSRDNWALIRAGELANEHNVALIVAFFVSDTIKNNYVRHYDFMLRGLSEVALNVRKLGAAFVMRHDLPVQGIVALATELNPVAVVTDQSYLRLGKSRRHAAAERLSIRLEAVDAAMVVPPMVLAEKQLYAAYIARPKLQEQLNRYLVDYPALQLVQRWSGRIDGINDQSPSEVLAKLRLDGSSAAVGVPSGEAAAARVLSEFVNGGITAYDITRNDPNAGATSRLSAYLHFGQISAQRVIWDLRHSAHAERDKEAIDKYVDELLTWREVSTNFCAFNTHYNNFEGLPDWGQKSLDSHTGDERDFIYTRDQYESCNTHDELWNAAQQEMVKTGRMHGYMRMYWAKKILEWSVSPSEAIETAVYLNDKYELDGREPNGYAGILWAIGGLHDRPWFERDVYGQVRYMNYNGAKKKFDVAGYIARVEAL